ncbi:hypothetical protein PLESTB_001062000 [Pleodorina starrii]|uniref:YchJ-like middle NTF2-like domain-containing protein n=1 Tax=Pleodorina starrii TaxID=330485 RepID=A0A9W6BQV4_9CHLO|nr:hypothetical protein PLESTM_001279900 [Pleodorina starrii]GLC56077.1 hypothetical protein PLESTB_001062000 [Pleodorina starrii]GLC64061.1 hypothetical protein PLESTF_000114100 [Pleodorina starrii]
MQHLVAQSPSAPAAAASPSTSSLAPSLQRHRCPSFKSKSSPSGWTLLAPGANWAPSSPSRSSSPVAAAASGKAGKGASSGKGFGAANAPSVSKSGVSQTCACGSKIVYRQCCEPYHLGAAAPPDVEAALRARFCAFVKGRVPYLVSTFHPSYHSFKYEGSAPGGATAQLRRDVEAATKVFTYSNLKVLEVQPGSGPDEAFITFRYNSVNKVNPKKNFDGSIKISTTLERSRFVREPSAGGSGGGGGDGSWLFADYELIDYPTWMEEAKQSELRARGQQQQQQPEAAAAAAAPA